MAIARGADLSLYIYVVPIRIYIGNEVLYFIGHNQDRGIDHNMTFFLRLISNAAVLTILMGVGGVATAQLPPDTQFIEDIKDKKYGDSMTYLVNGGPPNVRDYNGIPAIVAAAEIGEAGMVKEILKYGGNVNMASKKGRHTALMQGSSRGYVMVIAVLLTNNANMDAQDDLGETALIKAVKESKREIVGYLLDAGADIEISDYSGYTANDHAQRSRDSRIKSMMKKAVAGQ
jgi:ankyrin repeat protein